LIWWPGAGSKNRPQPAPVLIFKNVAVLRVHVWVHQTSKPHFSGLRARQFILLRFGKDSSAPPVPGASVAHIGVNPLRYSEKVNPSDHTKLRRNTLNRVAASTASTFGRRPAICRSNSNSSRFAASEKMPLTNRSASTSRRCSSQASMRVFDCCFEEISHTVQPVFEHRTPRGVFSERQLRPVFNTDLTTRPRHGQQYAFAGEIKPEKHGGNWMADHATYPGLTYLSSEGEIHTFVLPVKHPGHAEFRGCSGAPIVGEDARSVNRSTRERG